MSPRARLGPWLAGPVCVCGGPRCEGAVVWIGRVPPRIRCGAGWSGAYGGKGAPGRGLSLQGRCLRGRPTAARRVRQEMFERFTDRARRVVVLAQEEARMLNHNYIGTEHLLLGLIHEGEGVAAKALESMNISLEG